MLLTEIKNTRNTKEYFELLKEHQVDINLLLLYKSKKEVADLLGMPYNGFAIWLRYTRPYLEDAKLTSNLKQVTLNEIGNAHSSSLLKA